MLSTANAETLSNSKQSRLLRYTNYGYGRMEKQIKSCESLQMKWLILKTVLNFLVQNAALHVIALPSYTYSTNTSSPTTGSDAKSVFITPIAITTLSLLLVSCSKQFLGLCHIDFLENLNLALKNPCSHGLHPWAGVAAMGEI